MPRPRKPTHLALLAGDREDRINRNGPTPAAATILPPYALSENSQAVWNRLAPDLIAKNILTAWDVDMFAVFCDAVAIFYDCQEKIGSEVPGAGFGA